MYKILTRNAISVKGLERFERENYEVASDMSSPDAILLRSHVLSPEDIPESTLAIARAGAGVNNIPLPACTERGVVVFNTPGANANAVKELVLAGMLLGSRNVLGSVNYSNGLGDISDHAELNKKVEAEKKQFKGSEIKGKTLGVVGLGAIGSLVASMALDMGMDVVGYDPALSVQAAWRLPSEVESMENLSSLFARADFVSLHLPVLDSTRNLINADSLKDFKKGACLLNFAREQIVDVDAVVDALNSGTLSGYICDFPNPKLIGLDNVFMTPHIGASTVEAEENCAVMAANQLKDFLENGNIVNSVNFPKAKLGRSGECRLTITNQNIPKMLSVILAVLADQNINVIDMLNKSRDDIAYNLIDLESTPSDEALAAIRAIEGVINVRVIC